MRVKVLISFVSRIDGKVYRLQAGDELELPKGTDWVKAGLVEAVSSKAPVAVKPSDSSKKKAGAK